MESSSALGVCWSDPVQLAYRLSCGLLADFSLFVVWSYQSNTTDFFPLNDSSNRRLIGSLSYAELGTVIPKSGGEYCYLLDGLGPFHRFWGPLPAFLYSWISVLLLRPTSLAIGCLSCARYTVHPILASFGVCLGAGNEDIVIKFTTILYIGTIVSWL